MIHLINVAHAGVIEDAPTLSNVAINVLNFLLSVVGIIAIISLVTAAVIYLTAGGDEKRMEIAKNAAQASVLGIVVAMGGMIVVSFVGQFFK